MNFLVYGAAFALWAVGHSVLAGGRFKRWVRARLGERAFAGFYRLLYNIVAAITFLPILVLTALTLPQTVIRRVPPPWAWLLVGIQVIGLLGALLALVQADIFDFLGLRQVAWYFSDADPPPPPPPPPLTTGGVFGLVRHPLYFFSLLLLWFSPIMTVGGLIFNVAVTLYFWFGSIYEERKLATVYGPAYERYRARVPRLLPWPRPGK